MNGDDKAKGLPYTAQVERHKAVEAMAIEILVYGHKHSAEAARRAAQYGTPHYLIARELASRLYHSGWRKSS